MTSSIAFFHVCKFACVLKPHWLTDGPPKSVAVTQVVTYNECTDMRQLHNAILSLQIDEPNR